MCAMYHIFIDRIAGEIIRLVASVCACVSVRLSVGALLFDLDFWHEGRHWLVWDWRSKVKVKQ